MCDIWAATLKGLYCLGDSLGVPSVHFRFVPSSHIRLPTSKVLYHVVSGVNWSCAFRKASWAAVWATVMHDKWSIVLGAWGCMLVGGQEGCNL